MIGRLFFDFCLILSLLCLIDFVTYSLKSAPRHATLNLWTWRAGFAAGVFVLYMVHANQWTLTF